MFDPDYSASYQPVNSPVYQSPSSGRAKPAQTAGLEMEMPCWLEELVEKHPAPYLSVAEAAPQIDRDEIAAYPAPVRAGQKSTGFLSLIGRLFGTGQLRQQP